MKTLQLPSGREIPILGQGTWRMGEKASQKQAEIDALRLGIDLGMTLIDTAEMYGEGGAEKVVAEAISDCREEVFLVSKFYPYNASYQGVIKACNRSLSRLKTDYIDLYLLHWRGSIPLSETLEALQHLKQAGKILDYGVSNFDVDDMEEALSLPGGDVIATNQVLYNLMRRGIEWDLLPWCKDRHIPIMAYSPIEQKAFINHPKLAAIAKQHHATPTQIALNWLLRQDNVISIPKATNLNHVRENRAALDINLTEEDLKEIDRIFPPPNRKQTLAMR
ncbi:Aldehyde reductase [Stanieria cyanosphaera PCC 7437]|uniref:Aldehyde reductase n=1 Tax=Stanieria cyanosphaera (strain ATCC 29371 / PCC 7437) TaxID=111780 RepID=K9XM76_STAC7|nr:aldo/keto reductase [Stanieria cyanosphaera]AFZ33705.1 Aldehyde reductase [Stanieria cyanosphaera PCC 7437]